MIKRTLIERKCPSCNIVELVRKDGVGKYCRPCRAKINSKNKKPKNILGKKFGKLKVINFSHIDKHAFWLCQCECGNKKIISGNKLRNGHTKSCGCIVKTKMGMSLTPTFRSYKAMLQRCYDPFSGSYERYGAKGIKVCKNWLESFEKFLNDMGERPTGKTLDRIDNSKGYNVKNCRWLTPKEQAKNKKQGCFIEAFGKTLRLTEWSEITGIKWPTLRKRIFDLKWPIEKALTKKK